MGMGVTVLALRRAICERNVVTLVPLAGRIGIDVNGIDVVGLKRHLFYAESMPVPRLPLYPPAT